MADAHPLQHEAMSGDCLVRDTQRRLDRIVEALPGLVYTFRLAPDGRGSFPFVSPAIEEIYGLRAEDVRDDMAPIHALAHPEDRPRIEAALAESARTMAPSNVEWRICRPGLPERWVDGRSVPERQADGSILWHGIMLDITERKRTEEKLKAAVELLDGIVNAIPDILFEVDLDGRYLNVFSQNPDFQEALKPALLGRTVSDVLSPENAAAAMAAIRDADEKGHAYGRTIPIVQPDGELRWYEHSLSKKRGGPGSASRFIVLSRDVTERVHAVQAMEAREREFRSLAENSPDSIVRYDIDLCAVYVNPAHERITGLSADAAIGKPAVQSWPHPMHSAEATALQSNLLKVLDSGVHEEWEFASPRADGSVVHLDMRCIPEFDGDGRVVGILAIARDVTERKALALRAQEARRLEGLGRLAGGIAHDFNNQLAAILGFAELIFEDLPPDHPGNRYALRIQSVTRRGKALVEQILTFARQGEMKRDRFRLPDFVTEAVGLLQPLFPQAVHVRTEAFSPDLAVEADKGQLEQVLMNLCVNARDAMEGMSGCITVATRETDTLPEGVSKLTGAVTGAVEVWTDASGTIWAVTGGLRRNGRHASLIVSDGGQGMDAAVLRHAFEPFFTTKDRTQGNGLGLAVVQGIVLSHEGAIIVRSRPGAGTSVEIILPAVDAPLAAPPEGAAAQAKRQHGKMLLVDDDPDAADPLAELLTRRGWEVTQCGGAAEALNILAEDSRFRIVLSDQVMAGMRGTDLIREIARRHPGLPCLLYSGYDDHLDDATAQESGAKALLAKPLSLDILLGHLARHARDQV